MENNFIYNEHTGDFVDVQGVRIRFSAMGDGDPVLFVHGPAQTAYTFRYNIPAFAERFLAIAPDMVGYGYSDKPDLTYSIEENSEFLLALLNALRIKKTHIVALGMGAAYTLDFMIHYPERVGRAIAIAPGGMTKYFPGWMRMLDSPMGGIASAMFGRKQVAELISAGLFDQTRITEADIDISFAALDSREAKQVLRRSLENFNEEEVLSRLKFLPHETMFVWGEDDRLRPYRECAENYVGIPPRASRMLLRNTGHLVHEEKPQKFNDFAMDFLSMYRE